VVCVTGPVSSALSSNIEVVVSDQPATWNVNVSSIFHYLVAISYLYMPVIKEKLEGKNQNKDLREC